MTRDANRAGLPHHDGSANHVQPQRPALGDDVRLRLHVPDGFGDLDEVWVRGVLDGEPEMVRGEREDGHWWTATLPARNPVTHYRWLLLAADGRELWCNGTGTHDREVTDDADFRVVTGPGAPSWVADGVLYQVFPDRFARAAEGLPDPPEPLYPVAWDTPVATTFPDDMHQCYGGDLRGVASRLDHVEALGADGIYLNPIFPAPQNHRYNASSFDVVDPILGGDQALAGLASAMRDRDLRLVGDLTPNHTGHTHEWFVAARADRDAPEHGFYHWIDWPDTYEAWAGVPTLPKLDHRDDELRARLYDGDGSIVDRWLRPPFELDGWRVDAANVTGRCGAVDVNHEVARTIRATVEAANPDAFLLAEHCHDTYGDLDAGGWHGTMNYLGFAGPVWSWLQGSTVRAAFFGLERGMPPRDGVAAATIIDEIAARMSWDSRCASLNLIGSHDTPRVADVVDDPDRLRVAVALLLTFPGVPSIYYGDEIGLRGPDNVTCRGPFPWDDEASWDVDLLGWYRELVALRSATHALRRGGFRWLHVEPDAWVLARETADDRVVVAATRGGVEPVTVTGVRGEVLASYGDITLDPSPDAASVTVATNGPAVAVLR